jgi:hypothetical protein
MNPQAESPELKMPLSESESICFEFYGLKLLVRGKTLGSAQGALQSYKYFQTNSLQSNNSQPRTHTYSRDANGTSPDNTRAFDIVIQLHSQSQKPRPSQYSVFSFRGAKAFGFKQRLIVYPDGAAVLLRTTPASKDMVSTNTRPGPNSRLHAHIYSDSATVTNELLFLLISSLTGWELEKRGWIRLHAVGWQDTSGRHICENGVWANSSAEPRALALLGDSGTGKSSHALGLLQAEIPLYSDEITLISPQGVLYPWPIPIQLSADLIHKFNLNVEELPAFPKRLYATKYQLFLNREQIASPAILSRLMSPHSALGVLYRITLGTGLPQILELQLRIGNLTDLVRILLRRFTFATRLLRRGDLCCKLSREHWSTE